MIRLIRRKAEAPPAPVALSEPMTPEEKAWWQVEKRRYQRRAFVNALLTWAIPMAGVNVVQEWRGDGIPLPGDPGFMRMVIAIVFQIAVGAPIWFGMTWAMSGDSLRVAALRQRRVRDVLLAPPDDKSASRG